MSARRWTAIGLTALSGLTAGLALTGTPAFAETRYQYSSQLELPGGENPNRVAVDDSTSGSDPSAGDVYVANTYLTKAVYKFNGSGVYQSELTGAPGGFKRPFALAVGPNGEVYVADQISNVVDEFNSSGAYQSQITGFASPSALAVDSSGNLYVVDGSAVKKFDAAGSPANFSSVGTNELTGFEAPEGVAVDSSGNVYVTDAGALAVDKFNSAGVAQALVAPPDGFGLPFAIATDLDGEVFVGDLESSPPAVDGFDAAGAYQSALTLNDPLVGGSWSPASIGVDAVGDVYVVDESNKVVDLFRRLTLPDVATGTPATDVTATSATLVGTIDPAGGLDAHYSFEYGANTSYSSGTTTVGDAGSSTLTAPGLQVSATLDGLAPNSTYHYRLVGSDSDGSNPGADQTFTTLAVAPSVSEPAASAGEVTHTSVVLSGVVNPKNAPTFYHFIYGTSSSYGSSGPELEAGFGSEDETLGQFIDGLEPDTTYHYALVATNKAGTVTGPDQTFTTSALAPPVLLTGGASEITQTTATISGTVDTEGMFASIYGFDLGIDTNYTKAFVIGNAEAGVVGPQDITAKLQGLQPGTTYHYRLFATNTDGTTHSLDASFTTAGPPNPSTVLDILVVPAGTPLISAPAVAFPAEPQTSRPSKGKPPKRRKAKRKSTRQQKAGSKKGKKKAKKR